MPTGDHLLLPLANRNSEYALLCLGRFMKQVSWARRIVSVHGHIMSAQSPRAASLHTVNWGDFFRNKAKKQKRGQSSLLGPNKVISLACRGWECWTGVAAPLTSALRENGSNKLRHKGTYLHKERS